MNFADSATCSSMSKNLPAIVFFNLSNKACYNEVVKSEYWEKKLEFNGESYFAWGASVS